MKLSIFSRLTLGYFIIFVIMGIVNGYTLWQLHQISMGTKQIINVDERVLELKKKLSDTILSQMGYEKKFVITKDSIFHEQFLSSERDFSKHLKDALYIADTHDKTTYLNQIKNNYNLYYSLVMDEAQRIKDKKPFLKDKNELEKEKLIDNILEDLKTLENTTMKDVHLRMNTLSEAGSSSRALTLIMWITALVLVLFTSFFTTRSITKPLTLLMEKTKEISKGIFKGDLKIGSPPEMAEVTSAFNVMCDKLNKVDKMKSDFFSTMSHELRTPLASIKEGIGLLQEGVGGTITDKQQRLLTILTEESNRLIGLVNSLLDIAKMEAGMMTYHFSHENLAPLIQRAIQEISPLMEAKKIKIWLDTSEELPHEKIDKERMLQVLRNLISNAVKFTPEHGQIIISAYHENRGILFSVQDTGPGIPKENLHAIFEKFHQPPVKTSEWTKGTGLGLAIVKNIVVAHGGEVWAESELGHGSTFFVLLPS
ncbi:MAG: integral rane sensor signal transduction histidine kinase [Deltaproteobacteria bacterium]|nr:integral rane sensor signal transduction histidine kinase [Deltaproteobacteria bacterium]